MSYAAVRAGTHSGESSLSSSVATVRDTQALLAPIVGERIEIVSRINTIWVASFSVFINIALAAAALSLTFIWPLSDRRECESYFLAMYVQPIYWAFSFILDFYFRRKHTESRIEGYLKFYQEVAKYYRAPYYITTMWNALLLAMAAIVHQGYGGMEDHCKGNILDPSHFICVLLFLEAVINGAITISYIVKIHKFNKVGAPPDAMRDEWMASFILDSYSGGEVGYRERDSNVTDLLEKQADLLRYWKEQNARLVQKVMILSSQLHEGKLTSSVT